MNNHKFIIKKRFGQNFLNNENILKKIVSISNLKNKNIIEIGPGKGALTKHIIAQEPKSLFLIEKDKSLKSYLENLIHKKELQLKIIFDDVLKVNLSEITPNKKSIIIGNLPYNISTTLIVNLLTIMSDFALMIFMVQSEVADRLCAKVSSKEYGRISVLSQLFCKIEKIFDVSPENFFPKPKVNSTLIRIYPIKKISFKYEDIDYLLKKAFCFRRKKIRNNLLKYLPKIDCFELEKKFDLDKRPQDFSPQEYLKIYRNLFLN
tara:strand:+ start:25 stop:813 length:789 start_codon:yes stop_codon:yes gene_type:complete